MRSARRTGKARRCPPTGEVEALSLATGKVEWDTKVPTMPLGAATASNDLVITTLYTGVLIAFNRDTGARGQDLLFTATTLRKTYKRYRTTTFP